MKTLLAVVVLVAGVGAQFAPAAVRDTPAAREACPAPVVWNPLWSENPHGIGDRPGDRRRLTDQEILAVLQAQLQDPYRHPMFDSELQREIARVKKRAAIAP